MLLVCTICRIYIFDINKGLLVDRTDHAEGEENVPFFKKYALHIQEPQ